jgi:Tol biopolymer transport system component
MGFDRSRAALPFQEALMPMQSMARRGATAFAVALFLFAFSSPAPLSAQYFGRNKVQWEDFDWHVLKTEHFDIYYYPKEEKAVRDASRMAERWYTRLSSVFQREFQERKSIVLYADQSDFQQTTVVGGILGQGTGGVTEGLRTRVVLPLAGNYADTDHVLGHELTHVFQYDILKDPRNRETQGSTRLDTGYELPAWFIEGMAEYLSIGPISSQTAMWVRDALARDQLPDLRKMSRDPRLFPYRWGHAFWAFVGGRWGDATVARLFVRGTQVGIDQAMNEVLGMKPEDFSETWKAAIREAYTPVLEARQTPATTGAKILPRANNSIDEYIAPVLSPDGTQVIYLSTQSLFSFDLYLADAMTGKVEAKLVSEDSDPHFDAMRFLDSAGTWSPDGRQFAFVVLAHGNNEIDLIDVATRRIQRRLSVPQVGSIWNLAWSPDGRTLAFAGASGGLTDLYLLDLQSGDTKRLTNDRETDLQPIWKPDGKSLIFSSDRSAHDLTGLTAAPIGIWQMDVASGSIRPVAPGGGEEGSRYNPQLGPGGRDLYFLSDRDGVSDVYRMDMTSGQVYRVTHLTTGATGITRFSPALSVSPGNGRVMYSVFYEAGFQIHALNADRARGEAVNANPEEARRAATLPPVRERAVSAVADYLAQPAPLQESLEASEETADYHPKLQTDFVGPSAGVGVSTVGTSFAGDITAYFSDVLGQNEVGFTIYGGTAASFSEFGAQGYYLNQKHRLQWGGSAGHVPYTSAFTSTRNEIVDVGGQEVEAQVIEQVRETVSEDSVGLLTRFPFSETRRLEASAGLLHLGFSNKLFQVVVVGDQVVERHERSLPAESGLTLYQGSLAYVGDTSYFGYASPVRGQRYRFEIQPTFGDLEFQGLTADYRRYLFFRPVTVAMRGLHYGRYGRDAESPRLSQLYVGDPTLVHGYEIGSIGLSECSQVPGDPQACPEFDRLVGSRVAVANFEVRLPLLGTRGYGVFNVPFLPTELAAFVDAGTAWSKGQSPVLRFDRTSLERVPVVSTGVSARILLGGFAVLEFYYAKPFQRPDKGWVTGFTISPGW